MADTTEHRPTTTDAPDDTRPRLRKLIDTLPNLPASETAHLERLRDGKPSPVRRGSHPNGTNPAGWLSLDE